MGPIEQQTRQEAIERRARLFSPPPAKPPSKPEPAPAFLYRGKPYRQAEWEPLSVTEWWQQEIRAIPVKTIIRAVAFEYGVPLNDILSGRRTACVVRPRQIAMYLAKKLTTRSLPEIGRCFGGKDHTTVLHAVRKVESLLKSDMELVGLVAKLEARVSQA
jgi:hypothetical protein